MLIVGKEKVFLGGFHDHWSRNGSDNPSLLMAAIDYSHLDFMCLMDGLPADALVKESIEAYCPGIRIHCGCELAYEWGHVITVGGQPPDPQLANPDFRSVLAMLRKHCAFVAIAHPDYKTTRETPGLLIDEVGALLDERLADAIEPYFSDDLKSWVSARLRDGRRVPLVSGWDSHLLNPLRDLPPVLYSRERPPLGHIDSCGGIRRTIVFAEDNTLPSLIAAVCAGRSVIEEVGKGEFMGPLALIDHLLRHGYREATGRLDAARDRVRLALDKPILAGRFARLVFSEPGSVRFPGTLTSPVTRQTSPAGILETGPVQPLLARDRTYMPVVHTGPDGSTRVFAVELRHPIQVELYPLFREGKPRIELVSKEPFDGTVTLAMEGAGAMELDLHGSGATVPWNADPSSGDVLRYTLTAARRDGLERTTDGIITFVSAPRFTGKWNVIPEIRIDRPCFVPAVGSAWGANRSWPGAGEFSASARLAWTEEALWYRAVVRDPVHCQPYVDGGYFQGDSLQIGIDPCLRREDTYGAIAVYIFALSPAGPRMVRWLSPDSDYVPGFRSPPMYSNLGEASREFLTAEPWEHGRAYTLRIPWREMLVDPPAAGDRLGLFLAFHNNNGQGVLDTLHWPQPIPGMFTVPRKWGVVTLLPA